MRQSDAAGFQRLARPPEPGKLVTLDGQVTLMDGQLDHPGCKEVAAAQRLLAMATRRSRRMCATGSVSRSSGWLPQYEAASCSGASLLGDAAITIFRTHPYVDNEVQRRRG